ncbi:hypothetical protein JHW45_13035 [Paracoccus stylophorae]|uniref:Uncharacterized protein n=1 Tax=Paracoccus stylophorae TaxID=659350 RepID=A0ABY7SSY6_9RHOB|nr:hypothetical protein [Paracoccus stylophorae]WCR09986.1 hypothetical protein JHW45_13035 [Paracoccus stylophorae]
MPTRIGHEIAISIPHKTTLDCRVAPHESRRGDLVSPQIVRTAPSIPLDEHPDDYGNARRRMTAPAALFTLSGDATLHDSRTPDAMNRAAAELPIIPSTVRDTSLTG